MYCIILQICPVFFIKSDINMSEGINIVCVLHKRTVPTRGTR